MTTAVKTSKRQWWTICVGSYGNFEMLASEADAEEMRVHKARWEQSPTIRLEGRRKEELKGKEWNDIYNLFKSQQAAKKKEENMSTAVAEAVTEQEKTLTSHEAATLLQVNPTSVNQWVKQGKLKCYRTPGGHRRIMWRDFESFTKEFKMPIRGTAAEALDWREYARLLYQASAKGLTKTVKKKADKELFDFEIKHAAELAGAHKAWKKK